MCAVRQAIRRVAEIHQAEIELLGVFMHGTRHHLVFKGVAVRIAQNNNFNAS